MSPSVLDTLIYQEKKCPSEFSYIENAAEIQVSSVVDWISFGLAQVIIYYIQNNIPVISVFALCQM